MVGTTNPMISKKVVLRGWVSKIDEKATSFQFQPIYGDKVSAFGPEEIFDDLNRILKDSADDARLQVTGTGVYRRDKLQHLMQVEDIRPLDQLDVVAQLDDLRNLTYGWADGMQHPSDWGSGYGKAPSHEGLDWLADRLVRVYPDDLPLPRIYPTPEGGAQMEWTIGSFDISLEVNLEDRAGEWSWVDLNSRDEGETALNMDDTEDWKWVSSELRRFSGDAG